MTSYVYEIRPKIDKRAFRRMLTSADLGGEREYLKQSFPFRLCPVKIVLYQCLKKGNLVFTFCRRLGLWN